LVLTVYIEGKCGGHGTSVLVNIITGEVRFFGAISVGLCRGVPVPGLTNDCIRESNPPLRKLILVLRYLMGSRQRIIRK
jgi:hypothetical protein